jgi:hypothetical protein
MDMLEGVSRLPSVTDKIIDIDESREIEYD